MGMRVRSRQNGRAIVAEGEAVHVMFDYEANRKIVVPDEFRRSVEALEASAPDPGTPASEA